MPIASSCLAAYARDTTRVLRHAKFAQLTAGIAGVGRDRVLAHRRAIGRAGDARAPSH